MLPNVQKHVTRIFWAPTLSGGTYQTLGDVPWVRGGGQAVIDILLITAVYKLLTNKLAGMLLTYTGKLHVNEKET